MKTPSLTTPVSLTAALACLISLNLSCGKKNTPSANLDETPKPTETNTIAAATNGDVIAPAAITAPTLDPAITNPPLATTTPEPAPATPEPAPTAPIEVAPVHTIVEMPMTVPVAPTNFYSADFATKPSCDLVKPAASTPEKDYALLFRAGYQHVNHGDNHDTFWLSVKFAVNGDNLRERAGKNAWLVPDACAELSHQYLPKPDDRPAPGSGEGIQFRANFFWPWMHWTSRLFVRTNGDCMTYLPLKLGFGPIASIGFDQLFDGTEARLARYAGLRATLNHGFVEYTAGGTDGLAGIRSQVLTELPFYVSRKNNVRYYFRGLWNTGYNHTPDELEAGLFVELPLETLISPCKWGSLIPGKK